MIAYLPDGILNFLLISGSVCGFLSAFEIDYDMPLILLAMFLLSWSLAFICHYGTWRRGAFYLVFFILYFLGIARNHAYINSGFLMSDTLTSVNNIILFSSGLFILIINIYAADRKNILLTILTTMPLPAIAIYVRKEPALLWEVFLLSGYLLVLFEKYREKYKINGSVLARLTSHRLTVYGCVLMSAVILFSAVHLVIPVEQYNDTHEENTAKTKGYEKVAAFLIFGFSGFFNDYNAVGGMSGGQLGGINSVRPDYKTDLIVEFAPFSNETIYLRGFSGVHYTSVKWYNIKELESLHYRTIKPDSYGEYEALKDSYENGENKSSQARLLLDNVAASEDYHYVPYYFYTDDGEKIDALAGDNKWIDYTYYPYHELNTAPQKPDRIYLETYKENEDAIEFFCQAAGLSKDMDTEEIIDTLRQYFADNYTYTMSPGKTPKKEDFVTYFLNGSKKGYCSHFATAATLILRHLGIPARYTEGYALPASAFEDGSLVEDADYDEFYDGYNAFGETGVLRCEINDSQAHAWVEYFDEDFGWRVGEFTPPSTEEPDDGFNFWANFSTLMNNVAAPADPTKNSGNNNHGIRTAITNAADILSVILESAVVLAVLLFLLLHFFRIYRRYYSSNEAENLLHAYQDLCDLARKRIPAFIQCRSHTEQLSLLEEYYPYPANTKTVNQSLKDIAHRLEQLSYAEQTELSKTELRKLRNYFLSWRRKASGLKKKRA